MKKNSKISTLVALCVGVVALSVGFAAFSSQLVIRPSANVKPSSDNFSVVFSNTAGAATSTTIQPTVTGATAGNATIASETINSASASVIKGLTANFTEPGQKVVYSFYAYNAGEYQAFLNKVTFANASGGTSSKKCTAASGTDATKVSAACGDIALTLTVDGTNYTSTNNSVSSKTIAAGAAKPITVTIEYKTNTNGNTLADGDFSVAFGDITLEYGSVE